MQQLQSNLEKIKTSKSQISEVECLPSQGIFVDRRDFRGLSMFPNIKTLKYSICKMFDLISSLKLLNC